MARFLPPDFPERDFRRGEQLVWEALEAQLPGDAVVFYSLRLPDGAREREIDFVVALPGFRSRGSRGQGRSDLPQR